jgi:hypothetical protein
VLLQILRDGANLAPSRISLKLNGAALARFVLRCEHLQNNCQDDATSGTTVNSPNFYFFFKKFSFLSSWSFFTSLVYFVNTIFFLHFLFLFLVVYCIFLLFSLFTLHLTSYLLLSYCVNKEIKWCQHKIYLVTIIII